MFNLDLRAICMFSKIEAHRNKSFSRRSSMNTGKHNQILAVRFETHNNNATIHVRSIPLWI